MTEPVSCEDCRRTGGQWVSLRRCTTCGHVGCCDSSPSRHARAHFEQTGHPVIESWSAGPKWYWDYRTARYVDLPE